MAPVEHIPRAGQIGNLTALGEAYKNKLLCPDVFGDEENEDNDDLDAFHDTEDFPLANVLDELKKVKEKYKSEDFDPQKEVLRILSFKDTKNSMNTTCL